MTALACGVFALPIFATSASIAQASPAAAHLSRAAAPSPAADSATPRQQVIRKPAARSAGSAAPSTAPSAVFTSRVVAAAGPVRDRAGHTWSPRPATLGSWRTGRIPAHVDITGTTQDELYRTTAPGVKWYRLQVPAPATYRVRLLLAENHFDKVGQRVFDIRAEGRVITRNVDLVKRVGKYAADEVNFNIPVSDGRLDIEFTATKDVPVISGVEVVSATPVPAPAAPQPAVGIASDSFYFSDISKAPLAANSAAAAAHLYAQVRDNWGGIAAFNAYRFNNSFYEVPADQPKVRVNFHDCQRKGSIPSGLYDGAKHFIDVPMPANAVPASGTDKQITVYDRAADKLWDFWMAQRNPDGQWQACWGGRIDKVSQNQGIFPSPYGATAAGLAMTPGVISIEEFRRGKIEHAMYLAIIEPAKWPNFSWPANRTDGHSSNPDALAEGQRIRLDPSLDLSSIPMTPVARMIAEAAQKYGFVVTDRAGAVAVVTESGNAEKARTGKNPWDSLLPGPDYQAMQGFPWQHMQVLPKNHGKTAR
ncbi:malectin domain-containing carbohydrate-binding protein [Gephyromycinifex aptenodytis]|uniref:malectin domain-containing carbohydrate-binding protein n=1 Tax=Gephyromycinifex aptenodytis TaxID=2716227 RepID=UPI0014480390|nr:malectin domain-containing carbohydrate-binding protein [Gephyromycinifex aptenodytis]